MKCIYIDPPYNTGNESWAYNDNVNSPEIRRWLGEVVGKEGETLDRHDRWLCMMYPRLVLLRQFLRNDGAIFVSIDDNEVATLRLLMDEVFGAANFVSILCWQKRVSPANDAKYFSTDHEYVVIYAKSKTRWRPNKLKRTSAQLENYKNPDRDPRGPWNSVTYTCNKSADERPNLFHPLTNPNTGEVVWPRKTAVWKYDTIRHGLNEAQGLIYWGADGRAKMPRLKKFLSEMGDVVPRSFLSYADFGHTQEARSDLLEIIEDSPFATPKPARLIQRLLEIGSDRDSLILDSFAGSGTTAHAVLKQNAEDGGNRCFILVEMDEGIARDVTAERVKRVAQGYTNAKGEHVAGLGGGFQFCTLGKDLFDPRGHIDKDVRFAELANFVWFMETGMGLPPGRTSKRKANTASPLLGVHEGRAVYLLYNGILKDRSIDGGNTLTTPLLEQLPAHDGPRVVYAARCAMGEERLRRLGIRFKHLPYDLRVKP
ncbi:MAG: site-specific DNA-methyltransferase [Thermomonas sp.]